MEETPEIDEEEIAPKEVEAKPPEPRPSPESDAETEAWIAGKEPGSGIRSSQDQPTDFKIVGDAQETRQLQAAMSQLGNSDTGQPIAQAIQEHGTKVQFDTTQDDAIAQFDPVANAITIDHSQSEMSPAVLAAHLAHEGTHVQWNTPDSIDQEYDAFKTEAAVWNTGKGIETNEQCDWVSDMIGKGEADAKRQIRKLYPYLPER